MKPPKPTTRCHRGSCKKPFADHVAGACPDGRGSFVRHPADAITRASFSLSEREINALDIVTRGLINGRDLKQIAKGLAPELGSLMRRATKARATIERKKALAQDSSAPVAVADSQHGCDGAVGASK